MADLFGWDLVYKLLEHNIKKKEDDIALLIHFLLIKNGFKCIGLGDEKELSGQEKPTEDLPSGWSDSNNYTIRYISHDQLYILRGVPVNDSIVFNLLHVSSLAVTNVAFVPSEVVQTLKGTLTEIFVDHEELISRIRTELILPVKSRSNAEATTQTKPPPRDTVREPMPSSDPSDNRNPLRVDPPYWNDPQRDPLRVGGGDLDPLGVGGGGMIFNPFERRRITDPSAGLPNALPRGSVPPGARFDPFGPPTGGPRSMFPRPPDSDHFSPPGFGGGMFM